MKTFCWTVCLIGWLTLTGFAGDTLSIRLIEASNDGKGVAPELSDVEKLLKQNMPYSGYRLVDSKATPLPASATIDLAAGFKVKCSGKQNNLSVTVTQNKKESLRSTVELRDGKPLILGGFPGKGENRYILILLAR